MLRLTDVVRHLLIINVLMFVAGYAINTDMLALYYPESDKFQPWQIVTHFFMHANLMHLFFNMFALVMFGTALESHWGPRRFLFFYLFCAFGAAALHTAYNFYDFSSMQALANDFQANPSYDSYWAFFSDVPLDNLNAGYRNAVNDMSSMIGKGNYNADKEAYSAMQQFIKFKMDIPTVGASGAVYGLLLAFGMYFPNVELMLIFLPIPIKAKYFIPILMVIELFLGVNQFSWDNIAHFAHLGGALSGFLLILYWRKFEGRY